MNAQPKCVEQMRVHGASDIQYNPRERHITHTDLLTLGDDRLTSAGIDNVSAAIETRTAPATSWR